MLHSTNEYSAQQIKELKKKEKKQRQANKEKSKNDRILKAELTQLEQMRKYYILSSKQEIKKVCDRFDNRIAKYCFYKDPKKNSVITDTTSLNSVQATLGVMNTYPFSPSRVSTSRISSRRSSGVNTKKNNFESASTVEFSKTNDKNSLNQHSLLNLVNKMKNVESDSITTSKSKKTVSWNSASMNNMKYGQNDLLKSENSNIIDKKIKNSNLNSSSIFNKNEKNRRDSVKNSEILKSAEKKQIENINIRRGSARSPDLKSKARLGSAKSNDTTFNSEAFKKSTNKDAFGRVISAISAVKAFNVTVNDDEEEDEGFKSRSKFRMQNTKIKPKEDGPINQFLNSLKTTDSGFYTYLNSKGQPTCSGYDNFATLNKFNSASTASISSLSTQKTEKKSLINNLDTTLLDLKKTTKKFKKTTIEDDAEFLKSSSNLFNESVVLNQSLNDDDDYVENSTEAKKLYDNIFRAQTTRNLTMKKLVL
jgi:hypothetical protein